MRSDFDNNNSLMERKLKAYREYYIAEQKREAEERKEQLRIAKKLAAEAKKEAADQRAEPKAKAAAQGNKSKAK